MVEREDGRMPTPRTREHRLHRDVIDAPSVGDESMPFTCPRCGWPCEDLSAIEGSAWTEHGGLCEQCLIEWVERPVPVFEGCAECVRLRGRVADLEARLLAVVAAPSVDVDTSEAAAASMVVSLSPQRERIMRTLAVEDLTAEGIGLLIDLSGNSVRPRLRECETVGWVERLAATRATASGREAHLYRLTDAGRDELRRAS